MSRLEEASALWVRCAAPTSPPISLRARLNTHTQEGLRQGFEALSPWMSAPALQVGLLQVAYPPHLLTAEASALHSAFQRAHPRCSTYLPLCLPGPHSEGLRVWSTPHDCRGCLFREGGRCDGLGLDDNNALNNALNNPPSDPLSSHEATGGALIDPWGEAQGEVSREVAREALNDLAQGRESNVKLWLNAARPLAYWAPSAALRAELHALMERLGCAVLWDVGAGNGLIGHALCPSSAQLVSIEPVPIYASPPQALAWRDTAERALSAARSGELPRPDALLISWPSPGRSYRALFEQLHPQLIIRAYDLAGFCGVRRGYYMVEWAEGAGFRWWEARDAHGEYDDATPPTGYQLHSTREVESLYDVRLGLKEGERQGRLSVYTRSCVTSS